MKILPGQNMSTIFKKKLSVISVFSGKYHPLLLSITELPSTDRS